MNTILKYTKGIVAVVTVVVGAIIVAGQGVDTSDGINLHEWWLVALAVGNAVGVPVLKNYGYFQPPVEDSTSREGLHRA